MLTMADIAAIQILFVCAFLLPCYHHWGKQWRPGMLSLSWRRPILMSKEHPIFCTTYNHVHNNHNTPTPAPQTCSLKHVQIKLHPQVSSVMEKNGFITEQQWVSVQEGGALVMANRDHTANTGSSRENLYSSAFFRELGTPGIMSGCRGRVTP